MTPAEEARALNAQIPNPYDRGQYYPATLNGHNVKVCRKYGRGKQSNRSFLHFIKPCKVNLKTPSGEIIDTYDDFLHYMIELYNPAAKWQEVR